MPFLHPLILWTGLAAATVPVVIHLLNRRRYRRVPWAAMQFLLESVRRNRRRLRLEELLLLAVRTLIVLLLAVGLARFTGCGAMRMLPGGDAGQAAVFVLDDSYSLGQRVADQSVFALARGDLADQVARMTQADRATLLVTSRPEAPVGQVDVNTDPNALAQRVREIPLSSRRARLASALSAAGELLADQSGTRRVFLLSDIRKADLVDPAAAGQLADAYQKLVEVGAELIVIDYGRPPSANLTLQSVQLVERFAVAGMPARIQLTIANQGPRPATNVEIRLSARYAGAADGEPVALPVQMIDEIPPGDSRQAEIRILPPQAGSAVLSARLAADELPGDNEAHLAIEVRPAIHALVVDGRKALEPRDSESYFLASVIDPYDDGRFGTTCEVVPTDSLDDVDFGDYDLVFLTAVREFPLQPGSDGASYPSLTRLEEYVRDGGGLVIFTGPQINLGFYNGPLFAEGSGLCPFRLAPPAGDPRGRDRFVRLDPKSIAADSVMGVFAGEGAVFTRLIRFYGFHPADESVALSADGEVSPPRVIARFTDPAGSPAAVTRQLGRGTVIFFPTSASTAWTDWPIGRIGTFAGVMHALFPRAARAQARLLTGAVGEPIAYVPPRAWFDATVLLQTPQYPAEPRVPLVADDEVAHLLRYQNPRVAGTYEMAFELPDGTKSRVFFARNVDPAEGDLAMASRTDLATALGSDTFRYTRRSADSTATLASAGEQKEYWKWAIGAVLALLAIETWLAQRFGHYTT